MSKPTQPQNTPHPFDQLKQREANAQAKKLAKHPFWWLSKKGDSDKTVLFDAKSKLLWQLLPEDPAEKETHAILGRDFRTLKQGPEAWNGSNDNVCDNEYMDIPEGWHWVNKERTIQVAKLARFNTGRLIANDQTIFWCNNLSGSHWSNGYNSRSGTKIRVDTCNASILLEKNGVENLPISTDMSDAIVRKKDFNYLKTMSFSGWKLPSDVQLGELIVSKNSYLLEKFATTLNWRCETGNLVIYVDEKNKPALRNDAYVVNPRELVINTAWQSKTPEQITMELLEKGWVLTAHDATDSIASASVMTMLKEMDYRSVRLPKLEDSQFSDINKGIWEFHGMDEARLKSEGIYARDPARDVKAYNIAIDFGTSSTVVAVEENGRPILYRIGAKDFNDTSKSSDYENPTVLEFIDIPNFLSAWQSKAYRPDVNWDDVKGSHEAQYNFRNNQGEPKLVSSILPKMKQWALRQGEDVRVKIIDQHDHQFELAPLALKNPVKGSKMTVSQQDAFDPIELYAWFLGMTINWRSLTRGIFLRYFMTFPVAYPKEVKDKILASFRRGLHRSMPEPLVSQDIFHKRFDVKERASEPACFAASALSVLNIQPTDEGVAYSVFDFGGGTTDFDYGYYRKPTDDELEEDDSVEKVLEHIAAQGDKFLGGENLLENLAFTVFNHNIDVCRSHKISFTCPLDASPLPGTELQLDKTQSAQTNTIMLMARLRPFWESGEYKGSQSGLETIELLNREGQKVPCELTIPVEALDQYLSDRIGKGISKFLTGMKEGFSDNMPKLVHILLAGNSSRSKWVRAFFGDKKGTEHFQQLAKDIFKGQTVPEFDIHAPLEADEKQPFRPTAKTGVALGLLDISRGTVKSIIREAQHGTESAFNHFVGRIKQGIFHQTLKRNTAYGHWHELGKVNSDGEFYLIHTQSQLDGIPKGDPELKEELLTFGGDTTGKKVFIRAIQPNMIEACSAESLHAIEQNQHDNLQEVKLG